MTLRRSEGGIALKFAMRLTQFTDFALRVLIHAGVTPEPWLTVKVTASAFGQLSVDHVGKVVNHLAQEGWLEARRGRGGGFRLAVDPEQISILAVIRSCEPDFLLVECFEESTSQCPLTQVCTLTKVLSEAQLAFFQSLEPYSLADLLGKRRSLYAARLAVQDKKSKP